MNTKKTILLIVAIVSIACTIFYSRLNKVRHEAEHVANVLEQNDSTIMAEALNGTAVMPQAINIAKSHWKSFSNQYSWWKSDWDLQAKLTRSEEKLLTQSFQILMQNDDKSLYYNWLYQATKFDGYLNSRKNIVQLWLERRTYIESLMPETMRNDIDSIVKAENEDPFWVTMDMTWADIKPLCLQSIWGDSKTGYFISQRDSAEVNDFISCASDSLIFRFELAKYIPKDKAISIARKFGLEEGFGFLCTVVSDDDLKNFVHSRKHEATQKQLLLFNSLGLL